MIFKHFLATPFLLFSLATGYAAHHDGDAFGDRPSSSSFAAPSSTASSCAASSCAAPSFASPSSTTSSLKSAFRTLFSVPKTFLQSLYMTPDEINAGTVTTAQKLRTGLSDLTRAAKTFEPMALADPLTHAAENLAQVALTGVQTFNTLSTSQKVLFAATVGLAVLQTVDAATVYAPPSPVKHFEYDPRSTTEMCLEQKFTGYDLKYGESLGELCTHTAEYDPKLDICLHQITCVDLNSYDPATEMANKFGHVFGLPLISPAFTELYIKDGRFSLLMGQDCLSVQNALPQGWTAHPFESDRGLVCQISNPNSLIYDYQFLPPVMNRYGQSLYKFEEIHFAQNCYYDQFHFNPYGKCAGATGPQPCNEYMMNQTYGPRIPPKDAGNCTTYFSKDPVLKVKIQGLNLKDFSRLLPDGLQPLGHEDGGSGYPSLAKNPQWREVIGRKIKTDEL